MAKDQQLTVRVSQEEKREIERRAEAAGRSVSRYLAESGLPEGEKGGQQMMSSEEREELIEELRKLFREIRSIGGNVNQIARRLNQRKAVGQEAIERAGKAAEQAADAIIGKMEEVR